MAENRFIEEKALRALHNLGATPDQIAQSLLTEGIKGVVGCAHICPITRFLGKIVGGQWSTWSVCHQDNESGHITFQTPETIFAFMNQFDGGAYQFLREPT